MTSDAETTVLPHGSWKSPITAEMITGSAVGLQPGGFDHGHAYWTESRASEGGRVSIWRQLADGTRTDLTPGHNVRTMVHEYGGGAWRVDNDVVVFSSLPSNRVYSIINGNTSPLTPDDDKYRYAAFRIHADRNLVLAVREDHHDSDLDCVNTVVALKLDSDNPDGGTVLCEGADFYASPVLGPHGQLAWMEWDHPHMPWDSTRLMMGLLASSNTSVRGVEQVAGTATTAPCYPSWVGEELVFLDDPSGFWNFHAWRDGQVRALHDDPHDFCTPAWVFGHDWAALPDGRIACAPLIDGAMRFGFLADGVFTPWEGCDAVAGSMGGTDEDRLLFWGASATSPATISTLDPGTGEFTVLREAMQLELDREWISVPEQVSWEGPAGEVHALYYPPTNPHHRAPEGELPPLKVLSHGGPTGLALGNLRLDRQYWTSRGWAVVDVNYSGSAGYGRAYRERLQGTWGVLDVRDCADAALAMVDQGKADPRRLAIEGGSAGGYTTLAALAFTDVFAAGNSLYGIGDLSIMAAETHKFESRYLFGLLGGTPEEVPDVYAERSPILHLDKLDCAMLIQQGADDKVVPPNQATMMADAVRAKGLPVALLMFEGEGHGFRRAENIVRSLEGAMSFFGQVFGYEPADIPTLPIENISATPASS